MARIRDDLTRRMKSLEKELQTALGKKGQAFRYYLDKHGRARFEGDVLDYHPALKLGFPPYLLHSRFLAFVTSPVIWLGVIPFRLLDLFLTIYQGICFPVPKVRSGVIFDRGRLKYLDLLERLNCLHFFYANGLHFYANGLHAMEVAARTEQHWCPIRRARQLRSPHSRYPHSLDYGDAQQYRDQVESVRNDFVDLQSLTSTRLDPGVK